MTQAEKMQLRILAILDQSKIAWGDQANTINSVANQYRIFAQQVSNLGRVLGNLFIPIAQKALPIVNGLIIALSNLFQMLGVRIYGQSWLTDIMDGISGGSSATDDMIDGIADLEDGIDDVSKSANKLKKQLQGFDELNVINTKDESGTALSNLASVDLTSAISDAFEDYEDAWSRAFANIENQAVVFAEKIQKWLSPLTTIVEDFASGDYYKAGQDVSNLVSGIFDFFAKAIAKVDWYDLGSKMGEFLAGVDWKKIFASLASVIWEAFKGAIELAVGVFDSAPLEATVIAMLAIPKTLKVITASNFISGLTKLASKFKLLKTNVSGYLQNLDATGQILTFTGAMDTIRSKLTGVQKGLISAGASIGEFLLIRDAFRDITKGSEDLVKSLGEIAVGATVGASGLYVAFGTAGLAFSAIVAITGAIIGIGSAMNEIQADKLGQSIYNALSNPNGVSLSELTGNISNAFTESAKSFDKITEKSSGLTSVTNNISDVWLEIDKIGESMDAGVISVEEGKQKLEQLFTELATLTETKFSTMSDVILSAYGTNGVLRDALEEMGVDTKQAIDTFIQFGFENSQEVQKIIEEMSKVPVGSDKYKELSNQLYELTTGLSGFDEALNNFTYDMEQLAGKIDYSSLFPDGEFSVTEFEKITSGISDSLNQYMTSLDDSAKELTNTWQEIIASPTATEGQKKIAEEQISAISTVVSGLKLEAQNEIKDFIDMIETDFVGATTKIIEDAEKDWENRDFLESWWDGISGGTKDIKIQDAVKNYKDNLDKLNESINNEFGSFVTDNTKKASDAFQEIFDSVFKTDITSKGGVQLSDSYEEIINNVIERVIGTSYAGGKDVSKSYADGIADSQDTVEQSWTDIQNSITEKFDTWNSGLSRYSSNSIASLNQGLEDSKQSLYDSNQKIANDIVGIYDNMFDDLGTTFDNGFNNLSTKAPTVSIDYSDVKSQINSMFDTPSTRSSQTNTSNNGNQNISINIDGKAVFNAVVDQNNQYQRRTGQSAFAQ